MKPTRDFLLKHPAHFLAMGFGSGLAHHAPGTWGTLMALPIYLISYELGGKVLVACLAAILFLVGIWAAEVTGRALGMADHGGIVIDEIAAFLLVLIFTPFSWIWVGLAFGLFRLFDIAKPWPISVADQRVKGGLGVMLDDVLAAGYAIACLLIIHQISEGVKW